MIILSPYSRQLPDGRNNAKNYPYWQEVINELVHRKHTIIQVGRADETPLRSVNFRANLSLNDLTALVHECKTWASVDNFFPHLCSHLNKPGTVVWSRSDPTIYGYEANANLLKDRSYLRADQFGKWPDCPYLLDSFVGPEVVTNAILSRCN